MNFEEPSVSPSIRRRVPTKDQDMADALPSSASQMPGSPARRPGSKYIISHSGPMGSAVQQSTAAAYFARARIKQASNAIIRSGDCRMEEEGTDRHDGTSYDFAAILSKCAPAVPSAILKRMCQEDEKVKNDPLKLPSASSSLGKVRVVLRVASSGLIDEKSHFVMDKQKRQVTLLDPSSATVRESGGVSAPKMFAFDSLLTDEDPQTEVATAALSDAIHGAVVNGQDGCLFSFGHASLGKTFTMIGSDESAATIGVIPTALAWTFKCVAERKDKSNARFAIRASALEICSGGGKGEEVNDLLSDLGEGVAPPSAMLPTAGSGVMQNLTEVRCPTAEKAAQYLDVALSRRGRNSSQEEGLERDSHFVFTLHLYQYSVDSKKQEEQEGDIASRVVGGGRSRLHLIDFGCCERTRHSGSAITLSALGHVLLGIFNGQRHLPCKESPVTLLLKECLGSLRCQATMIAHVSPSPTHYSETLHTAQLASRIHRMRRKKTGKGSGSSGGGSGSGSSDEKHKRGGFKECTTSTDPSSSEQSCDTVIYVGRNGGGDADDTDAEHPPVYLPNMNSGDNRGMMANALRGSTAECDKMPLRGRRRLSGTGTLERRRSSGSNGEGGRQRSPLANSHNNNIATMGARNLRSRPGSVGATPTRGMFGVLNSPRHHGGGGGFVHPHRQQYHQQSGYYGSLGRGGSLPRSPKGKMPLHGRVAGYRQAPASASKAAFSSSGEDGECWIDQPHVLHAAARNGGCVVRGQQYPHPPLSARHSEGGDSGVMYGFMDDHKRGMIQQWVECQAAELAVRQRRAQENRAKKMVPVQAPPEISDASSAEVAAEDKPEPFAWLKNGGGEVDDPDCKVLAHFRTAESSSSDGGSSDKNNKVAANVVEATTVIAADVHCSNEEDEGEKIEELSVPPSPAVSSICPEENNQGKKVCGVDQQGKNKLSSSSPSHSSTSSLRRRVSKSNGHCKVEGESSGSPSKAGSKFEDGRDKSLSHGHRVSQHAGEREEGGAEGKEEPRAESISTSATTPLLHNQHQHGLPPPSASGTTSRNNNDQWCNIHSLDELQSHCERMARDLQDREEKGSLRRKRDVGGPKVEQEEMEEGGGEEEEQYLWVVRRDGGVGEEEEEKEEGTSRVINGVGDGDKPSRSSVVPITPSFSSSATTQTIFMTNRPSAAMTDLMEATNGDLQLSTVTEVTESSTTSEPSFSDESMDPNKLSTLDGKLLHYVNKANKTMEEKGVKQHSDDFFEQRFDQLSKLHDLYASVSSISAKSQSHLEERELQRQQLQRDGGGTWQRGSTYSLGALVQNSRDAADPASSSTSDLNSLCSEPVKMPDYADFLASRAGSVRSGLADVGLELLRRGDPNSISLSDLGFFQPVPKEQMPPQSDLNASQTSLPLPPPPSTQEGEVGRSIVDRSDSPVLEGIDQELAKYAKLKDLKQAYNGKEEARKQDKEREKTLLPLPPPSDTSATLPVSCSSDRLPSPPSPLLPEPPFSPSSGLRRDHVPDGASNPDLNHKVAPSSCSVAGTKPPPPPPPVRASSQQQQLLTPDEHHVGDLGKRRQPHPSGSTTSSSTGSSTGHHHHPLAPLRCAAVAPRRSPGTGQSSCSSDPEEILPLPPPPTSIMMAPSKVASRVSSSSSLVKQHRSHHHFYHQDKVAPPSASSSDGERRTATVGKKPHQKLSSTSSTSSASKADPVSIPSVSAATKNANDDAKRQEGRNKASSSDLIASDIATKTSTVPKDKESSSSTSSPSKAKVPRFSRLLASATRKISRSPLKIGKVAEGEKKKSVAASSSKPLRTTATSDSRKQREEDKKKGFLSSSQQQQQRRHPPSSTTSHHPDKEGSPSIVGVTPGKKSGPLLSPSSPSATAAGYPSPKNAKGTSSSKGSSSRAHHHHVSSSHQENNNRKQEQQINSDDTCLQAGKNKRSSSKKGAHTTATLPFSSTTSPHYTVNVLASPYSFPSAPTARRSRGDTSSNDSGLGGGCGGEAMMKGRQQGVVRMRQGGRGASSKASPSQQHRRKSNKHCRSSGYESSAADSLDSPISNAAIGNNLQPASEEPESTNSEQLTLCKELGTLPPLCLVRYEDEDVGRMDVRWRQEQVLLIKHEQERLKAEMDAAKSRINSDPDRWSYELHVEKSKRKIKPSSEEEEEAFVEAFAKETQILSKRVDACKAHVELVTCFDVDAGKSIGASGVEKCCTTECEFAQDIVLEKGDRTETELF